MFGIDLFIIKEFILNLFRNEKEDLVTNNIQSEYINQLIDLSLLGEGFVLSEDKKFLATDNFFNISGIITKQYSNKVSNCINIFKKYGDGWKLVKTFSLDISYNIHKAKVFFTPTNDVLIIQQKLNISDNKKTIFFIQKYDLIKNNYVLTNEGEVYFNTNSADFSIRNIIINYKNKEILIYINDYKKDDNIILKISYTDTIRILDVNEVKIKQDYYQYFSNCNSNESRFNYIPINSWSSNLSSEDKDKINLCFYDMIEDKFIYLHINNKNIKFKHNSYVKKVELFFHYGLLFILHESFRDEYLSIFEIERNSSISDSNQSLNLIQEINLNEEVKTVSKGEKINFFNDWMSSSNVEMDLKFINDFEYIQVSYLVKPSYRYNFICNKLILKRDKDFKYKSICVMSKSNDKETILKLVSDKIVDMMNNYLRKLTFYFPDVDSDLELAKFNKRGKKLNLKNDKYICSYILTLNEQKVLSRNNCLVIEYK